MRLPLRPILTSTNRFGPELMRSIVPYTSPRMNVSVAGCAFTRWPTVKSSAVWSALARLARSRAWDRVSGAMTIPCPSRCGEDGSRRRIRFGRALYLSDHCSSLQHIRHDVRGLFVWCLFAPSGDAPSAQSTSDQEVPPKSSLASAAVPPRKFCEKSIDMDRDHNAPANIDAARRGLRGR
jgi:hypothetical protein